MGAEDKVDYVPYYCEENIWRLLSRQEARPAWAVLAFGHGPSFAMRRQRAGRRDDGLVLWDYHVFALAETAQAGAVILDFDTTLGWRVPAVAYLEASFGPVSAGGPYAPIFRLVAGRDYTLRFYSDRSHMRAQDGSWLAPPPQWPHPGIDLSQADRWPLPALIDPGRSTPGELLDLGGLRAFVGRIDSSSFLSDQL